MPADFIIDAEHRVVFSRGSGVFGYEDYLEHVRSLAADPRFRPQFDQVVDCRGFTELDLTPAQLQDLAGRSIFAPESRRAFVVASDVHYGMSRMFATYRGIKDGQKIMVFRHLPDALAWLELPPDLDPNATGGTPVGTGNTWPAGSP